VVKIIEDFRNLVLIIGLTLLGCLIVGLRNEEFFSLGELKENFLKVFTS
jgi:hypothetical protein